MTIEGSVRAVPLRIGVDLTALLPEPTGVDRYLHSLVDALAVVGSGERFVLFVNREDLETFRNHPLADRVVSWSRRPRASRLFFHQLLLPMLAVWHRLDVLHSPSFLLPLAARRVAQVLTVYDMTSFTHPECHIPLRRSAPYRFGVRRSIARADLVTVPSGSAKEDLVRLFPAVSPAKIRVVRPGISESFRPVENGVIVETLERLGLPRGYLLFLGTLEPRKNVSRLLEAYKSLARTGDLLEDLVLVGRHGWGCSDLVEMVRRYGLGDRVHLTGYVDSADLPALLSGARALVYPSLHEGFGFPPLEAMACATPVVASRNSAMIENLEGAALLVDPLDVEELRGAIHRVLRDQRLRDELVVAGRERARRFCWGETARLTLACYREATLTSDRETASPSRSPHLGSPGRNRGLALNPRSRENR